MILMVIPFLLYSCIIGYVDLYILDHNLPVLLIFSFPANFQNVFTITICLLTETILLTLYLTWAAYFVFTVLSFILAFIQLSRLQVKKIMDG